MFLPRETTALCEEILGQSHPPHVGGTLHRTWYNYDVQIDNFLITLSPIICHEMV